MAVENFATTSVDTKPQPHEGALHQALHGFADEAGKLLGRRDRKEDEREDRVSTEAYLRHPELEAKITDLTQKTLLKDADLHKPSLNKDGSTTYTITQFGLSNRPEDATSHARGASAESSPPLAKDDGAKNSSPLAKGDSAKNSPSLAKDDSAESSPYYSRDIKIVMPQGAVNLGQCQFEFGERKPISEQQFNQGLEHERKHVAELNANPSSLPNVEFYSHGVYTYSNLSDTQALLLELTNGRPTVNIDWAAYPNTAENPNRPDLSISSYLHYMEDRASAKSSAKELAPAIDKAIEKVGADHTVMVGFSHGGMFDSRYLRHRVDVGLPKVNTVVFAHPDVPIKSAPLHLRPFGPEALLGASSSHAFVIGGQSDKQLRLAAFTPLVTGVRLGNDSARTRGILMHDHTLPITESDRADKTNDQHLLNYSGIASILNGDITRKLPQFQSDYIKASKEGRKH